MRTNGRSSGHRLWALALAVLLVGAGGCRKRPAETPSVARVSVERPTRLSDGLADWSTATYPARYSEPVLPAFPAEAIAAKVTGATVRADFVVGTDGRAHDVRLELTKPVEYGDRFVDACAAVLEEWPFSPAWRLARETDAGSGAVVLMPSKAHLIFHFDLDTHLAGGAVGLQFGSDR